MVRRTGNNDGSRSVMCDSELDASRACIPGKYIQVHIYSHNWTAMNQNSNKRASYVKQPNKSGHYLCESSLVPRLSCTQEPGNEVSAKEALKTLASFPGFHAPERKH